MRGGGPVAGVTATTFIGAQIPTNLSERLSEIAKGNERSVSAEVRLALKAHIEKHDQEAAA